MVVTGDRGKEGAGRKPVAAMAAGSTMSACKHPPAGGASGWKGMCRSGCSAESTQRSCVTLGCQEALSELPQDNAHKAFSKWCDPDKGHPWAAGHSCARGAMGTPRQNYTSSTAVSGQTQNNPGEPHSLPSLPDGQPIPGAS